jgi:hypothetical protein
MNDTETPLRETIAAWLRDEGHHAVVEAHDERYAEVLFRTRGLRFVVRVDESDPGFLYILLSMDMPGEVIDELTARRAAALTESRAKVVKVEVLWDSRTLVLTAEQLVEAPGGPAIFWRTVSFLEESFYRMRQTFDEEAGRAAATRFTEQLEAQLAENADASPAATENAQ